MTILSPIDAVRGESAKQQMRTPQHGSPDWSTRRETMSQKQFAFTGTSPKHGYVGFINISETENGIRFLVRSEGENPPTASYEVPKADGVRLLSEAVKGMAGEWLGMENAPKDGRAVLLRFPHHPVSIGRFEYGTWVYAFCMTEGGDSPDGWQPLPSA